MDIDDKSIVFTESAVPYELLTIILSHVPAETLMRFRCICKAWCHLIDDPYFIKIHTDRINHNSSSSDGGIIHLLHCNSISRLSLSLNLFENRVSNSRILTLYRDYEAYDEQCLSCNGLILTYRYYRKLDFFWSIRNPLTKEIHKFAPFDYGMQSTNHLVGFGYDYNAEDYKVVVMHYVEDVTMGASLYSLKSNSWKTIHTSSFVITNWRPGVFCNGALHWIAERVLPIQNVSSTSEDVIVAFDLENEEIRFLPVPSAFDSRLNYYDFGVLDGSLFLSNYCYSDNNSQIWLMDKYGDENSWSMLYLYNDPATRPIRYFKNKEMLLLFNSIKSKFVLIDLKKNNKKIIRWKFKFEQPLVFQPSLVRIPNGVRIQISRGSFVINQSRRSKKITQREANNTRRSVDINQSSKSKVLKDLFCCFQKSY